MNRNAPFSFDLAPHETMSRSTFDDKSHSHKTSFNVGDLIPIYLDQDILPGDTVSIKTTSLVRMQTLLDPIMDDIFLDTYFFFIPYRILWDHTKEFFGENTSAPWIQSVVYTIPQIEAPASTGWSTGTIADYMGLPVGVPGISVSALPFRAYAKCCTEWFRSENLSYPCDCPTDDTTITGVNTGDQVTDIVKGGLPFKAAKYKDYFTACLPSPQKAADTLLPLGNFAPVFTGDINNNPVSKLPMTFRKLDGTTFGGSTADLSAVFHVEPNDPDAQLLIDASKVASSDVTISTYPNNLYADLAQATGSSVNQLRLAFQLQKQAELEARSGSRYRELVRSAFGTISPDARMQIPEYLGGSRVRINVQSVTQSSESGSTPMGHQSAYSVTVDSHGDFSKSFTEHGILLGLAVARYHHSYQQGLSRGWSRKTKYDFYWPMLANIGEQAVLRKEIYCSGTQADDDSVFGYNEAWADYRYTSNRVSGEMRSDASTSLDSWHLADDYASAPQLSDQWIREDKSTVDRTLAVTSAVSNQLFGDFYFDCKYTRVMPVYSIPGLIDHH